MKRVGAVLLSGAVFFAQVAPAYACGAGLAYLEEQENRPTYYPLGEVFGSPKEFGLRILREEGDEEFETPEQLRFDYPFQFAPDMGTGRWQARRTARPRAGPARPGQGAPSPGRGRGVVPLSTARPSRAATPPRPSGPRACG